MKPLYVLFISLLLAPTYAYPEGQQDLNGWNVRWSDTIESGSTYARIRKSEWVDDHHGMKEITMAIAQNINNEVDINAVFIKGYASPPCTAAEKKEMITGKVNSQNIRMELDIWSKDNCEISYTWRPSTKAGGEFLRSAFNSGVVRFSHGSFDHIYDTRNSLPAYKLMKEQVANEEAAFRNAM